MKTFDNETENKKILIHTLKRKTLAFIKKNYSFIVLFMGIYLYTLSLERCKLDSESECYKIFFPKVGQLLFLCSFSGLIFSITYILPLIDKSKTNLLIFCLSFISQTFLYISDDGTTFQSHGGYNRILFIITTIIFLFLEIFLILLYSFNKKIKKIYSMIILGLFLFYIVFQIYPKITNSCHNWKKGLKNTYLNNDMNCKLLQPQTCWLFLFDGIFDFSKIFGINCKNNFSNIDVEQFYNNATIIAFPETQLFNFSERSYRYLQKKVLNNIIDISNESLVDQSEYEVVLDRKNSSNPKIKFNINKEFSLIQKKELIHNSLEKSSTPLVDNVLLIFIDALSRPQFKSKLPLVYEWIERFFENKTSSIETFQFFKYNSPIPNTQLSLGPILTGTHPNKRDVVKKLIYTEFKDKGFITAHSIDFCTSIPFYYEHNDTDIFHWDNFDYEMFSIFCDPNFTVYGKELGITQGPYSIFRRCLYGKDAFEYVLEFGDKFWNIYSDQKKFLQLSFIDAHEITLEAIKYLDRPLLEFLEKNEKSFLEQNTAIIFLSDHGLHMNGFGNALNLDDLIIELNLPSLFILLPRAIADSQEGINLKKNENAIIANFDIHNFLRDLSGSRDYAQFGDSMFNNLLIQRRDCERDLTIAYKNCRCFIQ